MKFGKSTEISIVNPGISLPLVPKIAKTKYPSFVYVGRLMPYKHVEIAIRAFAQVHAHFPNAMFTIAGFGESSNALKKLASTLNLDQAISFKGKVSEIEKVTLLSKSWVMLQPSMIEGWGITVIESNACGTPVIASNVPGLKDSVVDKKTGLLVEPLSPLAFSTAMEQLITDRKMRNILSRKAQKWSRQFSWDNSAHLFIEAMRVNVPLTQVVMNYE
jgi:glycosyltransferase involved in cell wall biosynthesis